MLPPTGRTGKHCAPRRLGSAARVGIRLLPGGTAPAGSFQESGWAGSPAPQPAWPPVYPSCLPGGQVSEPWGINFPCSHWRKCTNTSSRDFKGVVKMYQCCVPEIGKGVPPSLWGQNKRGVPPPIQPPQSSPVPFLRSSSVPTKSRWEGTSSGPPFACIPSASRADSLPSAWDHFGVAELVVGKEWLSSLELT